jgi:hypothetical protein
MAGTSMAMAARTDVCYGESWQAQGLLVTRDWLVRCAADLGNGAAITQWVRGGGGVSVSRSFPATLAFIRARC